MRFQCIFTSHRPTAGLSRLPARAIVIAPRGRHGLTILSTTLQDNSGCPSWLHTSKQVCSLGPSRTRHAKLSVDVHSTGPVLLSGVEPREVAP
jgi:hypothetical protein